MNAQTTAALSPDPVELTITLQDAWERAQRYGLQIQSADIVAALAREDRVQARAAALPSVNAFNQFIYTEGNGTPSGVFVANDGVHVYNEQAQVHEELLSFIRQGEIRTAAAALAVAQAKKDVAARGLRLTVVQNYYAIASAQEKAGSSRRSLQEAQRFLDITQKQEQGGEAAHSDVIKAQIQVRQRERDLQDADLAIQRAKIALAVLIFPTLRIDYGIEDDLSKLLALPVLEEVSQQASTTSPDLRAAQATLQQNKLGVSTAAGGPNRSPDASHRPEHASRLPGSVPPESGIFSTGNAEHTGLELGFDPQQSETGRAAGEAVGTGFDAGSTDTASATGGELSRGANSAGAGPVATGFQLALGPEPTVDAAALSGRGSNSTGGGGRAVDG